MTTHFDVIVVGAGLSGISAGWHLQAHCPDRSYVILEGRADLGGTWDLFRYPGIRSDSDMYTLGFRFKPWTEPRSIVDGASILDYVRAAAVEHGIDRRIRYRHRVTAASWSSADARWTVTVERGDAGEATTLTCGFLFVCSGYYDYERGHEPDFPDRDAFAGRIVHPQFWPDQLDLTGKRVVVIGSGATAVTLAPELAKSAARVTMLQRSPSYVVAMPGRDGAARLFHAVLPDRLAYRLTRWKNVLLGGFLYRQMRRHPEWAKRRIVRMAREQLGADYDVATHFTPHYAPWDQRLCLAPDADLFAAIKTGAVDVMTDRIARFTRDGIVLASGGTLAADVIVTATGLTIKLLGGIAIDIDGQRFDPARSFAYKGMMFSDVPNLALSFGYTNASWTLKADLTSAYVCRLLNTMRVRGMRQATPRMTDPDMAVEPFLDFTSGYVRRALDCLPQQGTKRPWKLYQNYLRDMMMLRYGSIDEAMEFTDPRDMRPVVEEASSA